MSRTARVSLLGRVWAFYCQQLSERPVLTRALTSTVGMGTGDAIAQLCNEELFSSERTLKYSAFGFLIHGPTCHCFYTMLDNAVPPTHPIVLRKIFLKICIDQTVWSPVLLAVFYSFMHIWDGTLKDMKSTFEQKFWPTFRKTMILLLLVYSISLTWSVMILGTSLAVWIPAHIINYGYIPPSQRILYVNIVAVSIC